MCEESNSFKVSRHADENTFLYSNGSHSQVILQTLSSNSSSCISVLFLTNSKLKSEFLFIVLFLMLFMVGFVLVETMILTDQIWMSFRLTNGSFTAEEIKDLQTFFPPF